MVKMGTKREEASSGEEGFSKDYWASNYQDPESMDCIGNVKEHFSYLCSLFNLEMIESAIFSTTPTTKALPIKKPRFELVTPSNSV